MILGIWGEDKSYKTTLGLSVAKVDPVLAHMELDLGGFARADWRYKDEIQAGKIITSYKFGNKTEELSYAFPFQGITSNPGNPTDLSLKPSKIVIGMKELWYRFLAHYITLLKDPSVKSIMWDTATLLWSLCPDAYLQEKQEAQYDERGVLKPGEKLRVQLSEIEFKEPNTRMRGAIYQAKAAKKNLILIHHAQDEYKNQLINGQYTKAETGNRIRKGWNQLGDSADMIVHCYGKKEEVVDDPTKPNQKRKVDVPYCTIELAAPTSLVGMEIREPTFEMLINMVKMARGEY